MSRDVIYRLERQGPYEGMRFMDIARLAQLYQLNLNDISYRLGFDIFVQTLPGVNVDEFVLSIIQRFRGLAASKQRLLLEVLDALLRGLG